MKNSNWGSFKFKPSA